MVQHAAFTLLLEYVHIGIYDIKGIYIFFSCSLINIEYRDFSILKNRGPGVKAN